MLRRAAVLILVAICSHAAVGQITARVCATRQQVRDFCGTWNVRVVFADFHWPEPSLLYFVDFSRPNPAIEQIAAADSVTAPCISPDGQWVAYTRGTSTELDGTRPSTLYLCSLRADALPSVVVRDSAYVPHFVQNSDTMSLVYPDTAGFDVYMGQGAMHVIPVAGGVPSGQPATLWPGGAYTGGLSRDGRFLAGGYRQVCLLDLLNSLAGPTFVHTLHYTDTAAGRDTVCRPQSDGESVSSSRVFTDAALYWDVGVPQSWVHNPLDGVEAGWWPSHHLLFISRPGTGVVRHFSVPADSEFGDTATFSLHDGYAAEWGWSAQWSNHPYFAAAPVQVSRVYHIPTGHVSHSRNEAVYIINLRDSTYLKVLEGTDLTSEATASMRWPRVWIDVPAGFQEDSTWLSQRTGVHGGTAPQVRCSRSPVPSRWTYCDLRGRALSVPGRGAATCVVVAAAGRGVRATRLVVPRH